MFNTIADYVKCVYHYKAHLSIWTYKFSKNTKFMFVPETVWLYYDQASFVIVHISDFRAPPHDHIVIYNQL